MDCIHCCNGASNGTSNTWEHSKSTELGPQRNLLNTNHWRLSKRCKLLSSFGYSLCISEVLSWVSARANFLPLQQTKSLDFKLISCLLPKVFFQTRIQCSFKAVCGSHLSAPSEQRPEASCSVMINCLPAHQSWSTNCLPRYSSCSRAPSEELILAYGT